MAFAAPLFGVAASTAAVSTAAYTATAAAGFGATFVAGAGATAAAGVGWGTYAMAGARALGSGLSAYGQMSQGRSYGAYGSYQKEVADMEAERLLAQREQLDLTLGRDVGLFRKKFRKEIRARGFVARVVQGVEATTGTGYLVALANAREADTDIGWMRYATAQQKRSLEDQAAVTRWKGEMAYTAGKAQEKQARTQAGISLLAGLGGAAFSVLGS